MKTVQKHFWTSNFLLDVQQNSCTTSTFFRHPTKYWASKFILWTSKIFEDVQKTLWTSKAFGTPKTSHRERRSANFGFFARTLTGLLHLESDRCQTFPNILQTVPNSSLFDAEIFEWINQGSGSFRCHFGIMLAPSSTLSSPPKLLANVIMRGGSSGSQRIKSI